MQYSHNCIKCQTHYTDSDPDPYYCTSCNEERKRIAEEVTRKLQHKKPKERVSLLKEYDSAPKVNGFMKITLN